MTSPKLELTPFIFDNRLRTVIIDGEPWFVIADPRSGSRCPVTNLTSTAIDKLTRPQADNHFKPPVESRVLKARSATRGVRLVNYLNSLPDDAEVR